MTLLSIKDLSIELATERGWLPIIKQLDLDVSAGEVVGLVGESGSGKSVTSLSIMGLLPQRASRIDEWADRVRGSRPAAVFVTRARGPAW